MDKIGIQPSGTKAEIINSLDDMAQETLNVIYAKIAELIRTGNIPTPLYNALLEAFRNEGFVVMTQQEYDDLLEKINRG